MIVVYLAAKLLELVFLLISLGILAFGLYEIVASAWLYAKGTAVEGRVRVSTRKAAAPIDL